MPLLQKGSMSFKYCLLVLIAAEEDCKREILYSCRLLFFQLLFRPSVGTLNLCFRLFKFGQFICKEGLKKLQFLASEIALLLGKRHVLNAPLSPKVLARERQYG